MRLIDRVLLEPEFKAAPPVLVDVGAAGGVPRAWRRIARHSIGVAFEPDMRATGTLRQAPRAFRRWILVPALAMPSAGTTGMQSFHLTRAPECSSILPPRRDALRAWAFSDFFEVQSTSALPATTIAAALAAHGLDGVDWLKCDTQGLDLRLFLGLSDAWRSRLLAAEFEPGIIDAYEGEDRLPEVLTAMRNEPFFLAGMSTLPMARHGPAAWSAGRRRWLRRTASRIPAWANLRYLRDVQQRAEALDRRAVLLAWVFAVACRLPDYAGVVAEHGQARFGGALFAEMARESERLLRWAMVRGVPRWLWHRFGWG